MALDSISKNTYMTKTFTTNQTGTMIRCIEFTTISYMINIYTQLINKVTPMTHTYTHTSTRWNSTKDTLMIAQVYVSTLRIPCEYWWAPSWVLRRNHVAFHSTNKQTHTHTSVSMDTIDWCFSIPRKSKLSHVVSSTDPSKVRVICENQYANQKAIGKTEVFDWCVFNTKRWGNWFRIRWMKGSDCEMICTNWVKPVDDKLFELRTRGEFLFVLA